VHIVNDFAAAASGIELLSASDLAVLQAGEPIAQAPRLVIGAGTGLGVAHLVWAGGHYQVIAGEAGHAGFAPAGAEQLELWRDLFARYGRVTVEKVVSGPGLARIYDFIQRAAGGAGADVTPATIVDGALKGDAASLRALDLFIACYGEAAGNLALGVLARGGVYIAGGIAPKILPRLQAGGFLAAFNAKGNYADTVRKIPVAVVINERLGLLGSALIAAR
jgi:glucokinase